MKRIIVPLVFAFAVNAILAQTYNMKIKQGTVTTYSVTSDVDEITFDNTSNFTCGNPILHGGETYPTVQIGAQCWFAKNLNIGTRINSLDGNGNPQEQTNNSTIEKHCYNNLAANCITYGGLYQWDEAMQYVTIPGAKGICPTSWHIPTLAEFQTLSAAVGNNGNAIKREDQGSGGGQGTNTSGFSALLAGYRNPGNGIFLYLGDYTYFWSSTVYNEIIASNIFLGSSNSNINIGDYLKAHGYSVRCVKD